MPEPTPLSPESSASRVSTRYLLVALFLLLALASPVAAQQGHSPQQSGEATASASDSSADWIMASIRPDMQETVQALMPENLPIYEIEVTLEPQAEQGSVPSITGHLTLTWVNTTGEPLESLPFRLYANGPDEDNDAQK